MRYLIAFLMGVTLAAMPEPAEAGHCKQFFHHAKAIVAPVVVQPVYYSVGDNIRLEALAEKVAAIVTQKLQQAPQTLPQTAPQSAFAKCIRCHSEGKSDLVLDGRKLTCDQYHRFDEIFMLRENIPPEMKALLSSLSQEEMGAMKEAVVRMGKPVPQTPAPPVAGGLE